MSLRSVLGILGELVAFVICLLAIVGALSLVDVR